MNNNQKRKYEKVPIGIKEQIEKLKSRGLIISDDDFCFQTLKKIGYYRFSAYALFFKSTTNTFHENITFDDVYKLYTLDTKLRLSILGLLTELEIYFKAQITDSLSKVGDPFILYDTNIVYNYNSDDRNKQKSNSYEYHKMLSTLDNLIKKSSDAFIKDYKKEYEDYPKVPIWIATEIMTCGNMFALYNILDKEYLIEIFNSLNINYVDLISWIHAISFLRNLCAHNCRIFNREISISPTLHKLTKLDNSYFDIRNKNYDVESVHCGRRVYRTAIMLDYLVVHIGIDKSFITNIFKCIDDIAFNYPSTRKPMGVFFDGNIKPLYSI